MTYLRSHPIVNSDRQSVHPITCQVLFWLGLPLLHSFNLRLPRCLCVTNPLVLIILSLIELHLLIHRIFTHKNLFLIQAFFNCSYFHQHSQNRADGQHSVLFIFKENFPSSGLDFAPTLFSPLLKCNLWLDMKVHLGEMKWNYPWRQLDRLLQKYK